MTLRLRRKRQTTAPALAAAKRINRYAKAALCAMTALAMAVSPADAAMLKWRAYRPPEIRPETAAEKADAEAFASKTKIQQASHDESSHPQSRLVQQKQANEVRRADNRQVGGPNPFSDPFEDGGKPVKRVAAQATDAPRRYEEPGIPDHFPERPADQPADAATDPRRSPPNANELEKSVPEDYFPEEPLPKFPQNEPQELPSAQPEEPYIPEQPDSPSLSDELRSFDSNKPAATATDCKAEKSDCSDALAKLKSNTLSNIDLSIDVSGVEGQDFPCECAFGIGETFEGRNWGCVTYHWKASGLCHKPLYFEQVAVERYGHSAPPLVQDVLCGVHFFASLPALPYMMGLCPPDECQYSLGYYRPGNCAPYLIDPIPLSLRAGLFEAGAIVGGILIIP
jgi:hypothetical protein